MARPSQSILVLVVTKRIECRGPKYQRLRSAKDLDLWLATLEPFLRKSDNFP